MRIYSLLIAILLVSFLNQCTLEGVNENDDITEENDSIDTNVVEDDGELMLSDSIDGKANEMVFQADDGLRIEWDIKNPDRPIELNDVVMVNYTARVAAGEVYDSNKKLGKAVPLKSNIGMMVPGWEAGLLKMNIGDKGRIMIPSALGYGENGYLTVVPPDADLIVDIEIMALINPIELNNGVKVYKWSSANEGKTPTKNQLITFDYFAYKMGDNAGLYDNSYQNEAPFSFKFENAGVVDGLHIGMQVMKEGESAFIEIPADMAYGKKGLLDLVPKNTSIVYDVRVASIE
jgi:peptidylprolyl isomerase